LYTLVKEKIYPRCSSCHSLDGKSGTGPSWRGLWQRTSEGTTVFADGTKLADLMGPGKMFESPEDYLRQSMLNPQKKIVMNFTGAMPTVQGQLPDVLITAVIDFIKHLDEFDDKGNPKPGTPAADILTRRAASADNQVPAKPGSNGP
jgi:cytochrome c oxidase subunit 2